MAAQKVRYVGPHLAVELYRPDGTVATVEHGGELETSSDHAAALLEQPSNWQPIPKTAPKKAAEKAGEK